MGRLPEVMPPGERGPLETYARRLRAAGIAKFPLDVWLDENGLVRRMSARYDDMEVEGRRADVSFAMELFDFGASVDVKPPPPNEVSDFEALQQGTTR